ncbi:MAG: VIT1/CCC1 transporter family protein [Rhodobacter sp.]|nr:VIT1/CCC1 transporter family protein [Rhodobacter sp.]
MRTEPVTPHGARYRLSRAQEFLKPIVYGGNDGIVTTFAIVAGFAGARAEGAAELGVLAILVFGFANLFADAVSMGLGEFLSGRSQRDLYNAQRTQALHSIGDGDGEADGVRAILRERGLGEADAKDAAAILKRSPDLVADLHMTYRMNMADPRSARPAANGLFTFLSFVILGIVPLVPYFILPPVELTFWLSVAATLAALAALGLLRWSATGDGMIRSVAETVLVGGICALVAYLVGALVAAI